MGRCLTIVGLGPGDASLRTIGSQQALDRADRIILRTRIHPGLEDLADDPRVVDCDDLYAAADTFDDVYRRISERVLAVASQTAGETAFAVPGHPRFGEHAVALVLEAARASDVPTKVLPAVSFLDVVAASIGLDPVKEQVQVVDALALAEAADGEPFSGGTDAIEPARGILIAQVHNRQVAAAVKHRLARWFPEEHEVSVVTATGVAAQARVVSCRLWELDRQPVDHLTTVWVPPLAALEAARSPATLQRIAARLRAPDGCPWDRAQTHASIRQAVIEEAYETVDAIDGGDADELADEFGDLLLQVALHSQIAEEAGEFTLEDVYEKVTRKLVRRHPHVFGEVEAETPGAVVRTWDAVKAAEREAAGKPAKESVNPVDALPRSMPALQKARMVLGPRKGEPALLADAAAAEAAGARILAAVEAALDAGIEPESALEQALRTRVAATQQETEMIQA